MHLPITVSVLWSQAQRRESGFLHPKKGSFVISHYASGADASASFRMIFIDYEQLCSEWLYYTACMLIVLDTTESLVGLALSFSPFMMSNGQS